jgi:hypothetical protein
MARYVEYLVLFEEILAWSHNHKVGKVGEVLKMHQQFWVEAKQTQQFLECNSTHGICLVACRKWE